jgi:hypothetical protein
MSSILKVDTIQDQSGNNIINENADTITIGASGDTISIPSGATIDASGATLTLPTTIEVDTIEPQSGTSLTLGASGDTITIPSGATITNSGTATGFGGGKVLQVVNTTSATQRTTTSTSFVDTGLSVSITPSSASSKILILFSSGGYADSTGVGSIYTLYRGASNLGDSGNGFFQFRNGGDNLYYGLSFCVYDNPSTTSATSYNVYMKVESGGAIAYLSVGSVPSFITALEISA